MSTNDVPGANPSNSDQLHVGCWAEHSDGSLVLVEGVESDRVVFSVFDMSGDSPVEYRSAMPKKGFEIQFTWNPKDKASIKWTWHDKTQFPWNKIIKDGFKDGARHTSADDLLNAAQRVAKSLRDHGLDVKAETPAKADLAHLQDEIAEKAATKISRRFIDAIQAFLK